jgi:hypothetical protein
VSSVARGAQGPVLVVRLLGGIELRQGERDRLARLHVDASAWRGTTTIKGVGRRRSDRPSGSSRRIRCARTATGC